MGSWSPADCGEGVTALGFGYFILVFNSCQDSLKRFMIRTCRSHSQFPRTLSFGFCHPRLYPSYHCHHLHIIIHVSLIHVLTWCPLLSRFIICLSSCRPFCFLACNFLRHTHILLFELVRCLLYHPLSNLIHVNVIPIHSPRCACVCLCFIRSPHCPSLIVILPSSLYASRTRFIHPSCVHYRCVSYHACAYFHFCYGTPHR